MQQPPFFSVWKNSRNIVKLSGKRCFCYGQKIFDDSGMENMI